MIGISWRMTGLSGSDCAPVMMVAVGDESYRLVGGASMPSRWMGRVTWTFPFAVIEINRATVWLRYRPRILGRLFGAVDLYASPADVLVSFPLESWGRGVGVRSAEDQEYYFWCSWSRAKWLLEKLDELDFVVSWEPRKPRLWRRG